ncbi:MAG: hypothetical protein WD648_13245, partial [Planctomycetaceae bacterium]
MRRVLQIAILLAAVGLIGPAASSAFACPMCKEAVEETGTALPRAYMYSILFMLGVPATVLAGFSIGMYRLSKSKPPVDFAGEPPVDEDSS